MRLCDFDPHARYHGRQLRAPRLNELVRDGHIGEAAPQIERPLRVGLVGTDGTQAVDRLGEEGDGDGARVDGAGPQRHVNHLEGGRRVDSQDGDVRQLELRLAALRHRPEVLLFEPLPVLPHTVGADAILVAAAPHEGSSTGRVSIESERSNLH